MEYKLIAMIGTLVIMILLFGLSFLIATLETKREIKNELNEIKEKKNIGFYPIFSEYGTYFVKFEKGFYADTKNIAIRCLSDSGSLDVCITLDLSTFGVYPTNKECAFLNPIKSEMTDEEFLRLNNIAVPTGRWVNIPALGVIKEFKFNI